MKNGFTLVELIVVITFIAILSSIGIASFVNYSKVQTLQVATTELISALNFAKSRSFSQIKPASCATDKSLEGNKVVISTASPIYEIDVVCGGLTFKIGEGKLPNGVIFYENGTTSMSFFFPVISNGVKIMVNDAQVQGSKTITLKGDNQTKTVTVDSVGGIR